MDAAGEATKQAAPYIEADGEVANVERNLRLVVYRPIRAERERRLGCGRRCTIRRPLAGQDEAAWRRLIRSVAEARNGAEQCLGIAVLWTVEDLEDPTFLDLPAFAA